MADLSDAKVLILAADLFEDMELLYPLYRLREEGVAVTLASAGAAAVTGKKGHGPVEADADLADVAADDFDALRVPGGFAPDKLRRDDHVLDLVRRFDEDGKPIALICHAGWVPISAGILKGRRATSVGAIRDDMVERGRRLGRRGDRRRRQPHLSAHAERSGVVDARAARRAAHEVTSDGRDPGSG